MDVMWIAIVAVVVVAVGAVIAKFIWRANAAEAASIRRFQTAVGTMEHFPDRSRHPTASIEEQSDGSGTPVERAGSPSVHITGRRDSVDVPSVPVRGNDPFPDPLIPLVFDDAVAKDPHQRQVDEEFAPDVRRDRVRKQALHATSHRPRRLAVIAVVLVVLVALGGLAVFESHRVVGHSPGATGVTTTTLHTAGHPARRNGTSSTATSVPSRIVATSSTSSTAVYPVGSTSYQVAITTTGPCWVDATSVSTGSVLWTGTLPAGAHQVIPATGAISLELGAPTATLTVDGVPVDYPTSMRAPFTATFQPGASG
jgi:flagellar basal body-associated protein FliL